VYRIHRNEQQFTIGTVKKRSDNRGSGVAVLVVWVVDQRRNAHASGQMYRRNFNMFFGGGQDGLSFSAMDSVSLSMHWTGNHAANRQVITKSATLKVSRATNLSLGMLFQFCNPFDHLFLFQI
jgi:hypothetical protein